MADLSDGESTEVKGSGAKPYVLKNTGGVYSCTCPAWRNQSLPIQQRTCKHLKALRGEAAERDRLESAEAGYRAREPGDPARSPALEDPDGSPQVLPAQGRLSKNARSPAAAKPDEPAILLAHRWDAVTDPTGWWMSEKLDGVRAWWDGRRFLSRLGNELKAPGWFTRGLPPETLDGELWLDRKAFQRTVSIVRRQDAGPEWKEIAYVVFDAPHAAGPFEARMGHLRSHFAGGGHPHARLLDQQICRGVQHLREELARIEAMQGEGVMLRQPGSPYEAGRSMTLLKVKTFHDAEARVVGHQPGTGRHKGRLGALIVENEAGTRFNVGTGFSDAERASPPPMGSLITYRYQELSDGGVPRFPSYVDLRCDL